MKHAITPIALVFTAVAEAQLPIIDFHSTWYATIKDIEDQVLRLADLVNFVATLL